MRELIETVIVFGFAYWVGKRDGYRQGHHDGFMECFARWRAASDAHYERLRRRLRD